MYVPVVYWEIFYRWYMVKIGSLSLKMFSNLEKLKTLRVESNIKDKIKVVIILQLMRCPNRLDY